MNAGIKVESGSADSMLSWCSRKAHYLLWFFGIAASALMLILATILIMSITRHTFGHEDDPKSASSASAVTSAVGGIKSPLQGENAVECVDTGLRENKDKSAVASKSILSTVQQDKAANQAMKGAKTSTTFMCEQNAPAKPVSSESSSHDASVSTTNNGAQNQADLLSAMSFIIAIVTLILTLGSTWFATKQKELQALIDKQNANQLAIATEADSQQKLSELLMRARQEMLLNYQADFSPSAAVTMAYSNGMWLAQMQSIDEKIREAAYGKLNQFFGSANASEFLKTRDYCREVKNYLAKKIDVPRQKRDWTDLFDDGI